MDTITMWMCKSIDGPITTQIGDYVVSGLFSERHQPACTCPSFKYGSGRYASARHKSCKHIIQAQAEACGWHEQWSDEVMWMDGICPRCEGKAIRVLVAV